ncbi:hypothetical protein H072_6018 [Dactylellina haptotyla CBS 200.50]|uniref:OTU domain-containing protein n=1 Tax=Dactylellina haptotyla (strain CBS 200.50) TaxID=1284197 RepID=S8BLB4_DACHA|nr:hypothetical protein H072_6018 [Dactylellina haptotyla CBS 200.50]
MSDEFPLLEGLGLYASDIIGDGDCLFRSFSDQLYGHQDKAHEIRLQTTSYMRSHAEYFKLFLGVAPPSSRKTRSSTKMPSEDAVDRAFVEHVNRMEKAGVYGDNLEIVAFARCYGVNVKIYQREFAYQVACSDGDAPTDEDGRPAEEPKLLHIAYHNWEHYSSVRNVDGPHKGLPNVSPKAMTEEGKRKQKQSLDKGVVIMPWMEKVVEASLPLVVPKHKIREMLEKCKGDVNMAVSKLLDDVEEEEEAQQAAALATGDVTDVPAIDDAAGETVTKEKTDKPKPGGRGPKGQKKQNTQSNGDAKPGGGKHAPKPGNRPKKETARERKERMQREKMEKKKAKTSGPASIDPPKGSGSGQHTEEGIKTLHV